MCHRGVGDGLDGEPQPACPCPELGQGLANFLCNSVVHRLSFAGLGAEIVIWVRPVVFGRDVPAKGIELTSLGRWGGVPGFGEPDGWWYHRSGQEIQEEEWVLRARAHEYCVKAR